MMDNNISESQLLSYFEGQINEIEKNEIEQWIRFSAENAKIAEEVYYIFLASETYNKFQEQDSQEALRKVNKAITRTKYSHLLLTLLKVAGVLLLPIVSVLLYSTLNNEPIEAITVKSTSGMVACFDLPDGTQVSLNSGSTLSYPSRFDGDVRSVILEGEAFFLVKRSNKRFIVNTHDDIQVEALGTEFNVEAYKKDDFVAVSLASGKIEVKNMNDFEHKQYVMEHAGEKIVYNKTTKSSKISDSTLLTDIAWKDGKVVLNNTSFEDLLVLLNKRFDVEFVIKNSKLKKERFTGVFDSQSLPKILEYLRLSSGIHYNILEKDNNSNSINEKLEIELY